MAHHDHGRFHDRNVEIVQSGTLKSKILLTIVRFIAHFVKYLFFTGSVLFYLIVLFAIILTLNPQFSFGFLKYFAFLNPEYQAESFHIDTQGIMKIVSVVSLALLIVLTPITFALKRFFNYTPLGLGKKILFVFLTITGAYVFSFALVAFKNMDQVLYVILIILYFVNIGAAVGYFFIDWLVQKIPAE